MRVAYILGALEKGGAESLIYDICRRFVSSPFESYCIFRKKGKYFTEFHRIGVPLLQVERKGSLLKYIYNLRTVLVKNKIDVIHSQTPSNTLVCLVASLFTRIRIVTTFHGFSFSDARYWERKLVYLFSKRIICVSHFEKEYYINKWNVRSPEKFVVIHNGIDFSKINITQGFDPIVKRNDRTRIIMVGSFIPGRSQLFICKVLVALKKRHVPFDMFFAGRRDSSVPERYDGCVRFCKENGLENEVHFLGECPNIPELLSQMDLFLYASEHDTFGIAIIEAIASGIPVIVNDWGVIKEITEDGRYAHLYKTGCIDDCVERVSFFLNNRHSSDYKEWLLRNATLVREKYSIENHIQKLNKLYLSCL